MGHLMGQVSLDELDDDEDRPVMSALVYGTEENMPAYGFWSFLTELGVHVAPTADARVSFWSEELKRCRAVYGGAPG